jgi:hypothetical protein
MGGIAAPPSKGRPVTVVSRQRFSIVVFHGVSASSQRPEPACRGKSVRSNGLVAGRWRVPSLEREGVPPSALLSGLPGRCHARSGAPVPVATVAGRG